MRGTECMYARCSWRDRPTKACRKFADSALVIAATIFGAVFPSLVAWTLVASMKGQPLFGGGAPKALMVGLLVNAAWGLGTGTGLALFGRRRWKLHTT